MPHEEDFKDVCVCMCVCARTHQQLSHTEKERRQAVNIISGLQGGVHCFSQQIETDLYRSPLCQLKISCSERDFITFIQSGKRTGRLPLGKCACTSYCNTREKLQAFQHSGPILPPQKLMIAPHSTGLGVCVKADSIITSSRYIKGPLTWHR